MTAVDFRCEQCGKLLSVDALPGDDVTCPHCQKSVQVPAALAGLPRPQIPGGDGHAHASVAQLTDAPPVEGEGDMQLVGSAAAVGTVAALLPWVMSLFLHLGVGLILSFAGMMMVNSKTIPIDDILMPGDFSKTPGGVIHPGGMSLSKDSAVTRTEVSTGVKSTGSSIIRSSSGAPSGLMSTAGGEGTAGGGMNRMGGMGTGHGFKGKFFGTGGGGGGNVHNVVFVIDRSGSMEISGGGASDDGGGNLLSPVKDEMRRCIRNLNEVQYFHIIFFATGEPIEMETKQLIPAIDANKTRAATFLSTVTGVGKTDPLPALKRAVAVLNGARNNAPGKQIFLLTDGDFPDNEAVKEYVKNNCKGIFINTYVFGTGGQSIRDTLKAIADMTGGTFKVIPN